MHFLPLLGRRHWPVVGQSRFGRVLLVFIALLTDGRQAPVLLFRRSLSPEQQQSVRRLRRQGSAVTDLYPSRKENLRTFGLDANGRTAA